MKGNASEYLGEAGKRGAHGVTRPSIDRLPPHSPEAEQGVLGCVLLAPSECLDEAQLALPDPLAFYDLRNRTVWNALGTLQKRGTAIDSITLMQCLKDEGVLDQVGGIAYLAELQDKVPSAANVSAYVAMVREKFLLRRWIALCAEVTGEVYEEKTPVEELVGKISTALFKLCETNLRVTEKTMREVMVGVHEAYLDKFVRGKKFKTGPMTGFNYLDSILPGLARGQLIVIAARPRTGKSALMMQIAEFIALVEKTPVAVFSLEMTAVSLGARALFQRAGSDMTKFLNGFMSESDVQKLTVAACQLAEMNLHIDESPRLSIEDLEIRCRRLVRKHNLGVIFVDYFQLLYVRNRHKQWSKADEMAEVSMRLKGMAKELNVAIVLCAQMNREIEKETHRRPRLSDLKDTGQLEQDADVVMFLWKPDVSSENWEKKVQDILPRVPCPSDWKESRAWKKNLAIITCTVEKQREGRSGEDATLVFIKPWTRFVDAYRPIQETKPEDLPLAPEANEEEEPHD
jgi:replicative DNA helicase